MNPEDIAVQHDDYQISLTQEPKTCLCGELFTPYRAEFSKPVFTGLDDIILRFIVEPHRPCVASNTSTYKLLDFIWTCYVAEHPDFGEG